MNNLAMAIIYECEYRRMLSAKGGIKPTRKWCVECVPFIMECVYWRQGRKGAYPR